MDFRIYLAIFILGTWILTKLKVQRHFIVFLFKTTKGNFIIEWIANISPGFWKFMADVGVVVSFGGLGGAYLSKHGQRKSLFVVELFLSAGVLCFIFLEHGFYYLGLSGLLLLGALISFFKAKSQLIDFLSATALIFLVGVNVFTFMGVEFSAVKYLILAGSVFGLPAIVLLGLGLNASAIIMQTSTIPGVSPLLPASRGGNVGVAFPGYDIFIPWWYALIALVITLVSHELAHGILARAQKLRIKSTGVISVGILPIGAFVEPDEEEVKSRPSIDKMRLYSVGSFANLWVCVFAGLTYVLLVALIAVSMQVEGLEIVETIEGYPAHGVLTSGTILYEVNGKPVNMDYFFPGVTPGDKVNLTTDRGLIVLDTVESPENNSKAYIGIYSQQKVGIRQDFIQIFPWIPANRKSIILYIKSVLFLLTLMKWIVFFNFNIALVNLIPMTPFDGGHMFRELLSAFNISEEASKNIVVGVLAFTVLLFLINISPLGVKIAGSVI